MIDHYKLYRNRPENLGHAADSPMMKAYASKRNGEIGHQVGQGQHACRGRRAHWISDRCTKEKYAGCTQDVLDRRQADVKQGPAEPEGRQWFNGVGGRYAKSGAPGWCGPVYE